MATPPNNSDLPMPTKAGIPAKRGPFRSPRSNFPYYGQSVGIIMLDIGDLDGEGADVTGGGTYPLEGFTRVPGDIGNATSFGFSVQYKLLSNVGVNEVITRHPTENGIARMVEAARELERAGVRAIATTCGFFSYFQDVLTEAVDIPVVSSALLQVPIVSAVIGANRKVGIITANSDLLTEKHLAAVGIDASVPHVLWGIQDRPAEESFWVWDELDPDRRTRRLEQALALTATRMQDAHPEIGAIVLECTNTPPGSHAVQKATGLPVFDVITLIKWTHLGVAQQRYEGYM